MMTRVARLIAVFCFIALSATTARAQSKCSGDKIKAAGKKAGAKLTCLSKGIARGQSTDSACLAKAEVKFGAAVAKSENKSYADAGCLTTGDEPGIESDVDSLVSDIDGLVNDTPPGPASVCDATKVKAAGKKVAAKLTCHAKAVTNGQMMTDSTCLAKAEVKFSLAVAKAESKSGAAGCTATGDYASYEGLVDGAEGDISHDLTTPTTTTTLPPPTCCNTPYGYCFDIASQSDANSCVSAGGTGTSGVCDGTTGTCQPTYGGESRCCRDVPGLPSCVEGPTVSPSGCAG